MIVIVVKIDVTIPVIVHAVIQARFIDDADTANDQLSSNAKQQDRNPKNQLNLSIVIDARKKETADPNI